MRATLTFHSIDDSGSPISYPPASFRALLAWLERGGPQVLALDELAEHPEAGGDAVAITFDDGFASARGALEALRSAGLPATIFVVSARVGRDNEWGGGPQAGIPTLPLLDWSALERLAAAGAAIGAHTRTHPSLIGLAPEALEEELAGCREELETRLGARVEHFAYPYGDVDARAATRVGAVYRCGHTTEFRALGAGETRARLPRLDMYYFRSRRTLAGWGGRGFARRLAWIRSRRALRARLLGGWAPRPALRPRVS